MDKNIPNTGFVDIQVNGFLGVDFSSPELAMNDVQKVSIALYERGTVAYCPTIITSSPDVYVQNLPLLARAMEDVENGARILGIHLEGPFLDSDARGAHPKEFLCDPDLEKFKRWQGLADGKVSILTVAPELPGACDLIKEVSRLGVIVGIGHHMASNDHIRQAVDAGVRICTHLGNGIVNMLPRHPNPLWSQLACDGLMASFITDGHHLPPEFVKVAMRAKGIDRFVVTADSAPLAGLEPGEYKFTGGQDVRLDDTGKISMVRRDALAGSASTMRDCVKQLAEWEGLTPEEVMKVGRKNPLGLLDLDDDEVLSG
jgi:N-acetylglucosamine-6-phosphate deacetylase